MTCLSDNNQGVITLQALPSTQGGYDPQEAPKCLKIALFSKKIACGRPVEQFICLTQFYHEIRLENL